MQLSDMKAAFAAMQFANLGHAHVSIPVRDNGFTCAFHEPMKCTTSRDRELNGFFITTCLNC